MHYTLFTKASEKCISTISKIANKCFRQIKNTFNPEKVKYYTFSSNSFQTAPNLWIPNL